MKKYIGTKVVKAEPMTRGEYNNYRGWIIPEDENPADEGYLVKYPDNYESWSPKAVFESAYHCFDDGMSFGSAIKLLKMGFKLKRKGWNGKGMFLLYVPANKWGIIDKIGLNIPKENLCDWIGMKTADNHFIPWLASQADMLAEDWIVVK